MYKYQAIKSGTFTRPFRFVKKGTIIESPTKLKINWLVDITKTGKLKDNRDLIPPKMQATKKKKRPEYEEIGSGNYKDNMDSIKKKEARQDAKKKEAKSEEKPAEEVKAAKKSEGTGSTSVI